NPNATRLIQAERVSGLDDAGIHVVEGDVAHDDVLALLKIEGHSSERRTSPEAHQRRVRTESQDAIVSWDGRERLRAGLTLEEDLIGRFARVVGTLGGADFLVRDFASSSSVVVISLREDDHLRFVVRCRGLEVSPLTRGLWRGTGSPRSPLGKADGCDVDPRAERDRIRRRKWRSNPPGT